MTKPCERIRLLNDQLRRDFRTGQVVITRGIAELGEDAVALIIKEIATYDNFDEGSDPHAEHDFGVLEAKGHRVFFKIDYYDVALAMHSPDPSDPAVTKRVLTIMLSKEY